MSSEWDWFLLLWKYQNVKGSDYNIYRIYSIEHPDSNKCPSCRKEKLISARPRISSPTTLLLAKKELKWTRRVLVIISYLPYTLLTQPRISSPTTLLLAKKELKWTRRVLVIISYLPYMLLVDWPICRPYTVRHLRGNTRAFAYWPHWQWDRNWLGAS